MKKIKGRNMLMFSGGKALAGNTECSVSMETETIEVAPTTNGYWRNYIAGCKTWKASSSHLLVFDSDDDNSNIAQFMTLLGQTVTIKFATIEAADEGRVPKGQVPNGILSYSGDAIVTSVQVSAQNGSHVSGSFEFQGTGPLTAEQADFFVDGDTLYAKSSEVTPDEETSSMSFDNLESSAVSDTTLNL